MCHLVLTAVGGPVDGQTLRQLWRLSRGNTGFGRAGDAEAVVRRAEDVVADQDLLDELRTMRGWVALAQGRSRQALDAVLAGLDCSSRLGRGEADPEHCRPVFARDEEFVGAGDCRDAVEHVGGGLLLGVE